MGKVVFGIVFCAGYVSKGPVDCEIARPIGRKCEPPFRSSEDTLTLGSCNFPGTGGCREAYLLMFKGLWSSGSRLPYDGGASDCEHAARILRERQVWLILRLILLVFAKNTTAWWRSTI